MNISHNPNVTVSRLLRLGHVLKSLHVLTLVVFAILIAGCNDSSGSNESQTDQTTSAAVSGDAVQLTSIDAVNTAIQDSADVLPDVFADLQETAPIVFEPGIINLGKMYPRELITSRFSIRNLGDRPITIKVIKANCACTKLDDYSGRVIPPGEAIELEARTKSREVPSIFTSSISFLFEEYIGQSTLSLYGEITRAIRTAPSYLVCTINQKIGQRVESGLVVVESLDGKPFNILSANGKEPIYEGFDPDFDEAQSKYTLAWDISQYNNVNVPGWWVIETDHPDCPVVDVMIRHESNRRKSPPPGPWRVRAHHVVVGGIEAGESAEFDVDIQNRHNTISTRNDVLSLSRNFKAKKVSFIPYGIIPGESTMRVRITPTPGYEGLLYGEIRFTISNQEYTVTIIGKAMKSTEESAE